MRIVNHIGAKIGDVLRSHWSNPEVIDCDITIPRWDIPTGTEILMTTPSGWQGAPETAPKEFDSVRWVQTDSVGLDAYPDWVIGSRVVTNARGTNAPALAEYAFCAILAMEKRFVEARVQSSDNWKYIRIGTVEGRTLALAGFGTIGRELARRALAFDMKVRVLKRSEWDNVPKGLEVVMNIEELVAGADHLVLAMPLTSLTRGIVNSKLLSKMKPGVHIVNIARGGLIQNHDLLTALNSGIVARASLDVTEPEPLPCGHPFYDHPNVRLTPHIAWDGGFNEKRMSEIAAENLSAYVQGDPMRNLFNVVHGY